MAGQYEEAVAIAQEILPASRATGLPLSWGTAERCLGGGRARLGFPADVVDAHLAESLRVFTLGDLTLNCAQTYVVWNDCCRRRGDLEDAARHLAEAVRLFTAGGCSAALSQLQTRFPT